MEIWISCKYYLTKIPKQSETYLKEKRCFPILRLAVYEMLYDESIPYSVSINEAAELAKKFDDEKARPFINGVLNSVKSALEAKAN